jgi:drug/metabolite transporter (DMT)-like permease
VTWAASVVYIKHLQRKAPISMLALTFWQMVVAAAALGLGLSTLVREAPVIWSRSSSLRCCSPPYSRPVWAGWCFTTRCAACRPACEPRTLATPVVGVLCAWLQLGERPSPLEATGMLLIAAGLSLLAWDGVRTKARA